MDVQQSRGLSIIFFSGIRERQENSEETVEEPYRKLEKEVDNAKKDEKVVGYYPDPQNNTEGYRFEKKMQKVENDAKAGKCRLLIWREKEI